MSKAEGIAHSEVAEKFTRFPIPEFDRSVFKDMDWQAPALLSEAEIAALIERQKSGDASAYGCYAIAAQADLLAQLQLQGEHCHAVLCVLPDQELSIVGRTYAWAIQRVWILDSLDPEDHQTIADWRTPRPMNTRLGPDNGVIHSGGILYAIVAHGYGDHWIGNRTILDSDWDGAEGSHGCRILSASVDDSRDFHDCNLSFEWRA